MDRDRRLTLFGDLRGGDSDFVWDLGVSERDRERVCFIGLADCFPFEGDLEWVLDRSFTNDVV